FALAALAVLIGLLVRGIGLDGAAVPPGGDAYHHAVITRLILDDGGLPTSYMPFAPISSFAYHFGFHAVAAPISLLTGGAATLGVQIAALLLNGLIGLSVFFC